MKKSKLTKEYYAEFARTVKSIAKYQRGEKVKGYTLHVRPAPASTKEVKEVRKLLHQTQAGFAAILGVSTKLVQAWEQGWRKPEPLPSKVIRAIKAQPKVMEILASV